MKLQKGILLAEQEQNVFLSIFYNVGKERAQQVPKKKVRGVELVDAPHVWVEQVFLFFSFSGADEEIWDRSRFLP